MLLTYAAGCASCPFLSTEYRIKEKTSGYGIGLPTETWIDLFHRLQMNTIASFRNNC